MMRTIALATLLLATTIAFGGAGDTPDLAPSSAASCTEVDLGEIQTGCIESAVCRAVEHATGRPQNCIE